MHGNALGASLSMRNVVLNDLLSLCYP